MKIPKANKWFRLYAVLTGSFLLAFCASFVLAPTEASNAVTCTDGETGTGEVCDTTGQSFNVRLINNPLAYYINVSSSAGAGGVEMSFGDQSGGAFGTVQAGSDTVTVSTNSPNAHSLQLSTSSNSNILSSSETISTDSTTFFAAGGGDAISSAAALTDNTWGFALPSGTSGILANNFDASYETVSSSSKFTKMPVLGSEVKVQEVTGASTTTTVYYGAKANASLRSGNYSNTVRYTAIADSGSEIALQPSTIDLGTTDRDLIVYTPFATSATGADLGTASVYVVNGANKVACTNPAIVNSNNFLYVTCTAPEMAEGSYEVEVTLNKWSQTYTSDTGALTYEDTSTPTMQNFTAAKCNALAVSTASNPTYTTLTDRRDGKTYKVSRLADNPTSGTGANNGICWMVQNLALNGTDSSTGQARVLTPADSDVTANRTLALDMTSGNSNATSVQIITSVQNNTTTSCNTSSYPDCIVSSEPYGNLYNWYAATATTGTSDMTNQDATDSVCPKGWKLPTNGGDGTLRSYGNLMSKSGLSATNTTNHTYVQNVQKAPLHFPLSGVYSSGLDRQGQYGNYWSRTAHSSSSRAYALYFYSDNGNFYPQGNGSMSVGRAVRCVLSS